MSDVDGDCLSQDDIELSDSDLMDPELEAELKAMGVGDDFDDADHFGEAAATSGGELELPEGVEDLTKLSAADMKDPSLLADLRALGIDPHEFLDPSLKKALDAKKGNKAVSSNSRTVQLENEIAQAKQESLSFKRAGDSENALVAFRRMKALNEQLARETSNPTSTNGDPELEQEISKAKELALQYNREGKKQEALNAYRKMQELTKQLEQLKNPQVAKVESLETRIEAAKQQAIAKQKQGDKQGAIDSYQLMKSLQAQLNTDSVGSSHVAQNSDDVVDHSDDVDLDDEDIELTEEDMNDPELLAEMKRLQAENETENHDVVESSLSDISVAKNSIAAMSVHADTISSSVNTVTSVESDVQERLERQVEKAKAHAARLRSLGNETQAMAVSERLRNLEQQLNKIKNKSNGEIQSVQPPDTTAPSKVPQEGFRSKPVSPNEKTSQTSDDFTSSSEQAAEQTLSQGNDDDLEAADSEGDYVDVDDMVDNVELSDGDLSDPELLKEMKLLEGSKQQSDTQIKSIDELRNESMVAKTNAVQLQKDGQKQAAIEAYRLHKQLESEIQNRTSILPTNSNIEEVAPAPKVPPRPPITGNSTSGDQASADLSAKGDETATQTKGNKNSSEVGSAPMLDKEELLNQIGILKRDAITKQQQGDKAGALECFKQYKKLESQLAMLEQNASGSAQSQSRLEEITVEIEKAKRLAVELRQQGKKDEALAVYRKMKTLETHAAKLKQATMLNTPQHHGPDRTEMLQKLQAEFSKATLILKQRLQLPASDSKDAEVSQWKEYATELKAATQVLADPSKPLPSISIRKGQLQETVLMEDPTVPLDRLRMHVASVKLEGEKLGPGTLFVKYNLGLGVEECYQGETAKCRNDSDKLVYSYSINATQLVPIHRGDDRKGTRFIERCTKRKAKFEIWYRKKRSLWTAMGGAEVPFEHIGTASLPLQSLLDTNSAGGLVPIRMIQGASHKGDDLEIKLSIRCPLDSSSARITKHDRMVVDW